MRFRTHVQLKFVLYKRAESYIQDCWTKSLQNSLCTILPWLVVIVYFRTIPRKYSNTTKQVFIKQLEMAIPQTLKKTVLVPVTFYSVNLYNVTCTR